MARQGLNEFALKHIKDNGVVFGEIAETLKISPVSLPRLLYANDPKLIRMDILKIISESAGIKDYSKLLIEIPESVGV